ncbi:MAG: methyltransferase domain-containing protein [Candidatus Altiarchaeota archaeon]|nr:methyltransferase domain-containing protein [Candidatus Altiarchaeota archaeon]
MEVYSPTKRTKILDVGVTCEDSHMESNFFEKLYPFKGQITCVGTEDGSHLVKKYEGLKFQIIKAGEMLPFKDREFDIVFSNAVVEHTGDVDGQRFFISELCRVADKVFVSTPYRWFPMETHTCLPLLHFLPKNIFRGILRGSRYGFWAYEQNLNLLSMRDLLGIFPHEMDVKSKNIRLAGFISNIIAYTL